MSELTSLSGRLLEPGEGREVLSRLRAASRWNSVSAVVTLQEGSSSVATTLLDLDREAQTWRVTAPETGETLARYRDGVMWTAEDGTVTPASFEEGPSPALGLLFPWRLPLSGAGATEVMTQRLCLCARIRRSPSSYARIIASSR